MVLVLEEEVPNLLVVVSSDGVGGGSGSSGGVGVYVEGTGTPCGFTKLND